MKKGRNMQQYSYTQLYSV